MRRNAGLLILTVITVIAISVSLLSPSVYFKARDYHMLETGYPRVQSNGSIAPQADEIYLVQAIQKNFEVFNLAGMYNGYSTSVADSSEFFPEMAEAGIIVNQNEKGVFLFFVEEKTEKVLMLKAQSTNNIFAEDSVVKNYISYLGLDVLDDWTEDTLGMSSRKAQLQIVYLTRDAVVLLAVMPLGASNYEDLNILMNGQQLMQNDVG